MAKHDTTVPPILHVVYTKSTGAGFTKWTSSVLSPRICDILTPGNSTAACHHFPGGFVSPMRVALYARISTHDQHTLAMQMDAMHESATRRGWTIIDTVEEI